MGILNQIAEFLRPTDGLTDAIEAAQNDVFALDGRNLQLQETITELQIKFEDIGWINTEWREGQIEFDRHQLAQIIRFSRLMFLKNPLINRGVNVQALYVFGQGVQVRSEDPATQKLIDGFWQTELNQVELTGHQALYLKECDLQVTGNLFFVFFPSDQNTIIRTIPVEEIIDIITNPEDRRDVWFFQRSFLVRVMDDTGKMQENRQIWLYPSLSYAENATSKPPAIGASPIKWETPIYHVKVGGLSDMMFGVPETYQALDWARSYTVFLENTATLMRKLSKFAFNLEVKGGTKAVAAAKAKLGTTVSGPNPLEHNPPSLAGSTFTSSEGAKLEVLKTAGAGVNPADGRYLRLMVAAAMGLPDTFFGDSDVGNHATAKTLDRPTELKFVDRQELWKHILSTIVGEAVESANQAVPGTIEIVNPEAEDGMDIDVMFPPILEHDVLASIQALTTAATLGGHASVDTIPSEALSRQMMNVLGFADIDELLQQLEKQVADAKAEAAKQQKLASDTALKQISAKAKAAPAPGSNANPQLQAIAAAASDLRAQVDEFFGKLSEAA